MQRYNPKEIEPKWQKAWAENGVYTADLQSSKPKYMAMSMFNYPSGAGIHIGHAMNYTISDVKARFKRQSGHESYHPIGWDAFGLPAENYAIKAGVSPQASMATIIPSYHKQYRAMGWSNDWSKEIATHQPEYYKWTQWIFTQLYKNGLVYQDARMQWWCDKCQTVLANEQVIDGKCWRHDAPDDKMVEKKEVRQWFFKITEYADELLDAIDELDWTESVKLAQKNWIGKSKGAQVRFAIDGSEQVVEVFTTRPDTLYGATFLVLAPEHELVESITTSEQAAAVLEYTKRTQKLSDVERQANKEKTGVFTGAYAVNPVNDEKVPIWIADYVLMGYGTGAIMAVPAHDERDYAFARKFELSIIPVVAQDFGQAHENEVVVEGSVVIGYDPATKKFMGLRNKVGSVWLTGGNRDNGEDFAVAAKRELAEETGYEVQELIQLGDPVYSHYYNEKKDSYRRSFAYAYLATIDGSRQGEHHREAHEDFVPEWFEYGTLEAEITKTGGGVEHWLEMLRRAKVVVDTGLTPYEESFSGEGILCNSGPYDGLNSSDAREKIVADLAGTGAAAEKVNYKMRDWSVSRQRYWGAPIPIINCGQCGPQLVTDEDLPVVLPELDDFKPSGDGRSALARATEWLKVGCPNCGGPAERETDTLDTYIDSSWYMLRYLDPRNDKQIFDSNLADKWMPVDFYNGGDHATAHLLYARFITRFFHKQGLVATPEPFKTMLYNGKVTASDGSAFSKSKGNGIDPLEIIEQGYGADALRTYLMFAAPLEFSARWDPQGVPGTFRFLSRLWNLVQEYLEHQKAGETALDSAVEKQLGRTTHQMIHKMTRDIENSSYNTAIAAAMATLNELYRLKVKHLVRHQAWQDALESLVACIAPFAPHISEELWSQLGHTDSVHVDSWPVYDEAILHGDTVTIVVQVNGKLRGEVKVGRDATEEDVVKLAKTSEKVSTYLDGAEIRKTVYVPGRLVNFVV